MIKRVLLVLMMVMWFFACKDLGSCHLNLGEQVDESRESDSEPKRPDPVRREIHDDNWGHIYKAYDGETVCYGNYRGGLVCYGPEVKDGI